jgi:hypothetical protein
VTTIDGGTLGSALVIDQAGAASVTGFKLTGGRAAHGGGVRLFFGEPTVTGCVITGNQAVQTAGIGGFGGGIYVYQAEAVITNNLVVGNSADIAGGGIGLGFTYFATVSYNTVVGNSALSGTAGSGPGIDVYQGAALQISNNLVISNTTPKTGAGGLQVFESPATIATNVLFGNTPLQFASSEGALPPGNLTTDPKFVSSVAGNYRLRVDSPALDSAGANPAPLLTDLDGNTRPVDGDLNGVAARDRGCYEQVGSLSGLAVSTASVVTWSPAPSAAAYHVYRSTIAGIRAGNFGGCQDARDPNLADTMFTEPDLPPSGTAFTFLATFSVNGAESSLGKTTAGAARAPAAYCP